MSQEKERSRKRPSFSLPSLCLLGRAHIVLALIKLWLRLVWLNRIWPSFFNIITQLCEFVIELKKDSLKIKSRSKKVGIPANYYNLELRTSNINLQILSPLPLRTKISPTNLLIWRIADFCPGKLSSNRAKMVNCACTLFDASALQQRKSVSAIICSIQEDWKMISCA